MIQRFGSVDSSAWEHPDLQKNDVVVMGSEELDRSSSGRSGTRPAGTAHRIHEEAIFIREQNVIGHE
jgi:hypothetical protein